jgi:hypothetical protein
MISPLKRLNLVMLLAMALIGPTLPKPKTAIGPTMPPPPWEEVVSQVK